MGNSASPGFRSGSAYGLRDVRMTDPEMEVERPPASPEPNRKSHEQLPVPQILYSLQYVSLTVCDLCILYRNCLIWYIF